MRGFRFRLLWLFALMLITAIGMVVGRQMVGFGWHRSLVFEMHFTAVLDGTSLKVIRFKDATTGLVCWKWQSKKRPAWQPKSLFWQSKRRPLESQGY